MKDKRRSRLAAVLLALFILAVPARAEETAAGAAIRLTRTEGIVSVTKSNGKSLSLLNNMRLYNGYHVATGKESYAWINLDEVKLIKEDASSDVEVRKNGKKLEVNVSSGAVFFNVSEDLTEDETLNISTSTMIVGIRGTSGWVRVSDRWRTQVCITEGEVQCAVTDPVTGELKTAAVKGGQMAECVVFPQDQQGDKCDIVMGDLTVEEIPGFVLVALAEDPVLCDKILEGSGLDVAAELAKAAGGDPSGRNPDGSVTAEVAGEADRRREQDEGDVNRKLEEIQKQEDRQENNISKEPVWVTPEPARPDAPAEEPAAPAEEPSVPAEEPSAPSEGSSGESDSGSTADRTHTVTLDPGGGTVTPGTVTVGSGGKAVLPDPTRTGWVFDGWYTGPDGTGSKADENTVFTGNTTLYAHWVKYHQITFVTESDYIRSVAPPEPVMTDIDGKVKLPVVSFGGSTTLTLKGWFTEPFGGTQVTDSTVFTEDTEVYARWTGWELGADGCLIVADNAPMQSGPPPWSGEAGNIRSAVLLPGVTGIGNNAFENCTNLTSINIPDSVTSLGSLAFYGCSSLESVTLPNNLTGIGNNAFQNCTNLTGINIPEGVTSIGSSAFEYCISLTSIEIPNSVSVLADYLLCDCRKLDTVTIQNSAITFGKGSLYCENLTTINYNGTMEEWRTRLTEDRIGDVIQSDRTVTLKCIGAKEPIA